MKTVKLCEICDVRDGTHDSPSFYSNGYPFITTKNLVNGAIDFSTASFICEEDYKHFDKRSHVDDGDILMPMIGTIGGAIRVKKDRDFAIKNVALIKKKNNKINFDFLLQVLNSNKMRTYFEQFKTGGTQKFISLSFIRNLPIPEISIEKQEEIANHLYSIQSAINNKKQQLYLLNEAVKSRFIEMFGEPIENTKSCKEEPLGNCCLLKAGKAIKASELADKDKEHPYPCFGGNGIRGYISKKSHTGKIVLIGRQGALCGNVQLTDGDFYATEHAVVTTPKKELNSIWLYHLLFLMDLNRYKSGAAQPGLTVEKLNTVPTMIVPIKLQNDFAAFVQQIDKSKFVVKQQIADLQELQDSKMQEYFGE